MQFDWLRMTKEERFDFKLASHSITFLENLHCTEIVNLASNNHMFTKETLRYFQRTNIEPFTYEKLLWLVASSNMNLNQKKNNDGLGVKDFIAPITIGALGPVIGPAGAGIVSRHINRYDEGKNDLIFLTFRILCTLK